MSRLDDIAAASARDHVLIAAYSGGDPMAEPPDKVKALTDAVQSLQAIGVVSALIGGVAVGVHSGSPRATLDTDLAIPSSTDRDSVVAALVASGFRFVVVIIHFCRATQNRLAVSVQSICNQNFMILHGYILTR